MLTGYRTRQEAQRGLALMFSFYVLLLLICAGVALFAADPYHQAWGVVGVMLFFVVLNVYTAAKGVIDVLTLPKEREA
jgi:hypothetical protein